MFFQSGRGPPGRAPAHSGHDTVTRADDVLQDAHVSRQTGSQTAGQHNASVQLQNKKYPVATSGSI